MSAQDQVCELVTSPSTVIVHFSGSSRGVTSAVSTGQSAPVSYWPGGSRGSRSRWCRPKKPRVGVVMVPPVRWESSAAGALNGCDQSADGGDGAAGQRNPDPGAQLADGHAVGALDTADVRAIVVGL